MIVDPSVMVVLAWVASYAVKRGADWALDRITATPLEIKLRAIVDRWAAGLPPGVALPHPEALFVLREYDAVTPLQEALRDTLTSGRLPVGELWSAALGEQADQIEASGNGDLVPFFSAGRDARKPHLLVLGDDFATCCMQDEAVFRLSVGSTLLGMERALRVQPDIIRSVFRTEFEEFLHRLEDLRQPSVSNQTKSADTTSDNSAGVIVEKDPEHGTKRVQSDPHSEKKRSRDAATLRFFWSNFSYSMMSDYVVDAYNYRINGRCLVFVDWLAEFGRSSKFYYYDSELKAATEQLCISFAGPKDEHWVEIRDSNMFRFLAAHEFGGKWKDWNAEREQVQRHMRDANEAIKTLIRITREHYLEVDLEDADAIAYSRLIASNTDV
ncbi:MAG: hypothetical protein WC538_21040 [Thermoanaerobaculia bacterium]|jgi:hypothetical protein